MKPNFTDPYLTNDPTEPHDGIARQGRSHGGKFTIKSILHDMRDEQFGINSNLWRGYAEGTIKTVIKLRGEKFAFKVLPERYIIGKIAKNKKRFSFRMITEMFEHARDSIQAGKSDEEAIQSAHDWLKKKQDETKPSTASPLIFRQSAILQILKDEPLNAKQAGGYIEELAEIETAIQKGGVQ